jgi:hypothetical protein
MVSMVEEFHCSVKVRSKLTVTDAFAKITPASAFVETPIFSERVKVKPGIS